MAFNFNSREHDPAGAFGGGQAMPIGKYPVVITGTRLEAVSTNANSGKLVVELLVIDGEHKNATGAFNLNLFNENEQARQIAARQLAALCTVTGKHQLTQEPAGVELWNTPFVIEFVQQKKNPQYVEVAGVWDIAGNSPGRNTAPTPSQSAPPAQFAQQPAPAQPQQPAQPAQPQGGAPWQQPAQPAMAQPQPAANGGWQPQAQVQPAQAPAQPAQPAAQPWSQQPASGAAPWAQR